MFINRTPLGILLLSTVFLNADKGDNPPAPAASEKPNTLPKALGRIEALEGELATAKKAATDADARATKAEGERDKAVSQFNTATDAANTANTERDQARTELATANTTIGTLTGERDQARGQLATANTNISRLEKLCGVKGVDVNDSVPSEGADVSTGDEAVYAKWKSLKGAAQTEYFRTNKAALDRYEAAHGDKEV